MRQVVSCRVTVMSLTELGRRVIFTLNLSTVFSYCGNSSSEANMEISRRKVLVVREKFHGVFEQRIFDIIELRELKDVFRRENSRSLLDNVGKSQTILEFKMNKQ